MKSESLIPNYITRLIGRAFLPALLLGVVSQSPAVQVTAPQLAVSEAAAGVLQPEAAVSFGTVARGHVSLPKTFKLSNSGTGQLTISQIRFLGGNATDFRLGAVTFPLVIGEGGETTVQVTVRPGGTGSRSTVMQLASDDGGTPGTVFPVSLSANAVTAVSVGFAASEINVNQGSTSAVLTLRRSTATLVQTVRVRTQDGVGSAAPYFVGAQAGVDYTAVDQVVSFGVGQLARSVTVPLSSMTNLETPNRRFAAVLSEPTGGAVLANTKVTVNIRATDTTKPVLTVSSPDAQTTAIDAAMNPVVTVQGTVTDAKGISRLTVSLNGATPRTLAFTVNGGTTGSEAQPGDSRDISFSAPIIARLGSNKLVVHAYDVRGNVSMVSRLFNYTGGVVVSVERVVPSALQSKPNSAGLARIKADPVSHVTPLAATSNVRIQQGLAVPNATLTLTATPMANHAFSHFENLPEGAQVTGGTAVFTMPASVTAVRAHFVAQNYTAPEGYGDTFQGLVRLDRNDSRNEEIEESAATSGMISAVMTSRGVLTGTIQMDQITQSFTGQAYADGRVTLAASGAAQSATLTAGQHVFSMSYDTSSRNTLTVEAAHVTTGARSKGYLRRAYYSAARKVPAEFRGYHTVTLIRNEALLEDGGLGVPRGAGFATFSLSETGTATVAGEMPDGSSFTCKAVLVEGMFARASGPLETEWIILPVYAQVKPPGVAASAPRGAFSNQWGFPRLGSSPFAPGEEFDVRSLEYDIDQATWFRPAYAASIPYAAGWPNGQVISVVGNRYNRTLTSQQVLSAGTPNAETGNIRMHLTGGKVAAGDGFQPLTRQFNVAGNTITQVGEVDRAYQLVISPTTGLVTGTFRPDWANPSPSVPSFRGMIVQKLPGQSSFPWSFGRFQSNIVGDTAPEIGLFMVSATPQL